MVDLIEFRSAKLTIDGDNLTFAVKASIEEKWDTIEYPKYLDSAAVATVPTLKKIFIHVRRRYMPSSTLLLYLQIYMAYYDVLCSSMPPELFLCFLKYH